MSHGEHQPGQNHFNDLPLVRHILGVASLAAAGYGMYRLGTHDLLGVMRGAANDIFRTGDVGNQVLKEYEGSVAVDSTLAVGGVVGAKLALAPRQPPRIRRKYEQ